MFSTYLKLKLEFLGDRVWGLWTGTEGKVEFSITFGCRMEHSV